MDSSGFSSPRSDCFPAGLRVLVVDDDPTWLKILEKMLKKCNYEVTTCNLAREALSLLRERKDGFDIVISDVNMPDMDGFKLLEHVGLEMDLPVIMMSVDGETSRVMKGVQHGACDYLLKPIRMKELRNIWQHVLRKRMQGIRDVDGLEDIHTIMTASRQHGGNSNEQSEEFFVFAGDNTVLSPSSSGKKRRDENCEDNNNSSHSAKKARVVWTVDLHQKFVKAVNQIGFEKAGPKKILDLMGVPWLTRENVASHLQKYRLYLTRLQKENELKSATFCGIKRSDFTSMEPNNGRSVPQNKSIENIITTFSGTALPILVAQPESSSVGEKVAEKGTSKFGLKYSNGPTPTQFDDDEREGKIELKPTTTNKVEDSSSIAAMLFADQPPEDHRACGAHDGNLFCDAKAASSHQGNEAAVAALRLWNEEFDSYYYNYSSQQMGGFFHPPSIGDLGNMEPLAYDDGEVVGESVLYRPTLWGGFDGAEEMVEYPIMDQGLFIA